MAWVCTSEISPLTNKQTGTKRNRGILITKGDMRNTPYQRYANYFEVKAGGYTRSNGTQVVTHTTRVRPRGIDFIRRTLGLHGAHPMLPMTFQ